MTTSADEAENLVTLDVYSGRPNPEWALSETEVRQLQTRIDGLAESVGSPPPQDDRLGYRGLRVTLRRQSKDVEVSVGNGTIAIQDGGTTTYYRDKDRQLERWLFSTGRARLSPQLAHSVDEALSKRD